MAKVACKQCLVSTFETPWATPNFIDKKGNVQIYVISSSYWLAELEYKYRPQILMYILFYNACLNQRFGDT